MANKKILGMLAVVLAFSMAVTGCGGDDDDENTDPKKITVTGITDDTSNVAMIMLAENISEEGVVAGGSGTIANGSVTFSLMKEDESDWTGTGSFYLILSIGQGENSSAYAYTDGKSLAELQITSSADMAKLLKYSVSSTVSTIPFSKFADVSSFMGGGDN